MRKYPCKNCLLINTCNRSCNPQVKSQFIKFPITDGICPDCGFKLISCDAECKEIYGCLVCTNCYKKFSKKFRYKPLHRIKSRSRRYCWNSEDVLTPLQFIEIIKELSNEQLSL